LLANLTKDESLAVQIAALDLVVPRGSVNSAKNRNPTSELALLEAQRVYLAQGAWRGEGRLLRAQRALASGETESAERELKAAIRQEPFFEGGYLNLADLYRLKMEEARARAVLQAGLKKLPDSGMLHYSLGLAWVRSKEYDLGLAALLLASELAPARTDFFYALLLVEDALGRRAAAQGRIMQRYGGKPPEAIAQLLRRWQREAL
jgi:tetratricopeptide (TPR) repeat protein